MLFLPYAFPLLLAASTASATADANERVLRAAVINQRTPILAGTDDPLGVFARQSLNSTGGTCSTLDVACTAAQGGGCCPFLNTCCGDGCCQQYYHCAIDENQDKPCKCTGPLCPDPENSDDDSDSDSDSTGDTGSTGGSSSDDSSDGSSDSSNNNSTSNSNDDNTGAGFRVSSMGLGATILVAGLVVAAL